MHPVHGEGSIVLTSKAHTPKKNNPALVGLAGLLLCGWLIVEGEGLRPLAVVAERSSEAARPLKPSTTKSHSSKKSNIVTNYGLGSSSEAPSIATSGATCLTEGGLGKLGLLCRLVGIES